MKDYIKEISEGLIVRQARWKNGSHHTNHSSPYSFYKIHLYAIPCTCHVLIYSRLLMMISTWLWSCILFGRIKGTGVPWMPHNVSHLASKCQYAITTVVDFQVLKYIDIGISRYKYATTETYRPNPWWVPIVLLSKICISSELFLL